MGPEVKETMRIGKFGKAFLVGIFLFSCVLLLSAPQPAHAQGKTIMVIAPHPDDEALCCSGVIYSNLQAGNTVVVVVVTNGDDYTTPASKSAGLTREAESVAAMTGLGLTTSNVIFLGYGDQLLQQLLFSTSSTTVYTSAAGQTKTYADTGLGGVSYHQYLTGSAGSYNQATILSDFESLLKNFAPTDIYTTGFWDDHPDHRATYAFTSQALIALKHQGLLPNTRIHETWIHAPCEYCDSSYTWPEPVFTPTTPFPEPEFISDTPYNWNQIENIPVPAVMQETNQNTNLKWNTIATYQSQTENDPTSYLFGFVKIGEFFWVRNFQTNVAVLATATASSQTTTGLQAAANAIDGIISGVPNPLEGTLNYSSFVASGGGEWVTAGQLAGAWIKLTWPSSVTTSQVILYGRTDGTDNVLSGTLTFSDGSSVAVGALPVGGAGYPINFASKTITWMQFTVNSAQGKNIGLSEIEVFGTLTSSTNTFGPQMTSGPVASSPSIGLDQSSTLTASTFDVYGYPLTYAWSANGGSIAGSGTNATFTAPAAPGTYTSTVTVTDGHGGSTQNSTFIAVPCSICGTISGAGGVGATIALSGTATGTTTANSTGVYDFTSALAAGAYTLTPSSPNYTFSPASQNVTVSTANVTSVNFSTLYSISGTVSGGAGATVTLSGTSSATTTANASGVYSFIGLSSGSYTVTSSLAGYVITPSSQNVTIGNANLTVNFLAQVAHTITGTISGAGGIGATVNFSGTISGTTTANSSGVYTVTNVVTGNYAVTPSSPGYTFSPSSQSVTIGTANVTGINFNTLYSVSGTITGAAGVTLTVSSNGSTVATGTSGAAGSTFSVAGLANGTYTLTPSLLGYTFAPSSASVTVNGANVTVPAFAATELFYTISGTITGVGGATVTLSSGGSTVETVTAGAAGSTFTLTNVPYGSYTVTPSLAGYTFTPINTAVTIAGANATGINFSGSESVFTTQTPALTGKSDGSSSNYELGMLFQSDIAGQITGIRFWKDSHETGTHTGHIWSSTGTLLATATFANETASGWQVQSLTTPLSINANTTYVVSVNTGATYYVQTVSGLLTKITNLDLSSVVTANNGVYGTVAAFPASSYSNSNYFRDVTFVPNAAPTYTISGTITGVGGATLTLSSGGSAVATTTASGSGAYSFTNVLNGSYTVTPSLAGYTFTPTSAAVTVNGANATVTAFAAAAQAYTISGTITGVGGATVTLSSGGSTVATITSGASGATYSFAAISNGSYTVTPSLSGYTFSPTSASVTVNGANATATAFTATAQTYTISGTISGAGGNGATVKLTGTASATTTANASGAYSFSNVLNGSYTVTPSLAGYTFSPTSASVTVNGANATVSAFSSTTAQTYTISGTIAGVAGATVTLSSGGSTVATITSGASGTAYSFTNVPNGGYTVTPSLAGHTFSPTSASVTVNGANATASAFTATASPTTYTITGTIIGVAGTTVTLSSGGSTVATITSGAAGTTYSFTNVSNGSYTVTPSLAGYSFAPTSAPVTVNGANVTGVNFSDPESVFTTQTPALTGKTDGSNLELGMLFLSDIAGQITGIRFWKDANETGTHTGNIWSSTGTLLATVAFSNETASGWQVQSLATPLSIAANTTYVVSVNTGNTYYVDTYSGLASMITNLDLSSVVTANNGVYGTPGTFPTSSYDNSNYFRDVTFLPNAAATYTISGTITGVAGATVTLSSGGSTVATITSGASGTTYSFTNVPNGSYTVTPSLAGYTFSPTSAAVTVNGANATATAFTATAQTYTISGTITGAAGATVTLSSGGSTVATITSGASGTTYSFTNVPNGSYTVTPSLASYTFSPTSASVTVNGANASATAFTATAQTYTISGTITGVAGATVTLSSGGSTVATITSGASGTTYSFTNVPNGSYTVTPSFSGYTFSPTSAAVTVNGANASATAFTATATVQTYTISGTITGVAGATVTLSSGGSTVATVTSGASGATYSFSNVPNGSYTVTPTLAGYTFAPTSTPVTVSGANVTGVNFAISESLFTTQTPALTGKSDGSGVNYELGMLFQSDIAGQITGVRFWKDSNETGTHTGHIWSSTGTLLATVVFSNETASGWQVQSLATPLSIAANTQYMVSVNTGNTYYVDTYAGLGSQITNLDLSSVVTTNNGAYGSVATFPTSSYDNSNYFRDVIFVP
jgi:LmbE family N-acetylglucosaminyl deacetylase